MRTRVATAMASGTATGAARVIAAGLRAKLGDDPPALVLAFASTSQPLADVTSQLAKEFPTSTVLGASTAGEFTEEGDARGSVSAFALLGDFKVFAGVGMGLQADPKRAVAEAALGLPRVVDGYPCRMGILLLDPLAGNGEEVTLLMAVHFDGEEPLVGGAAGDDLQMKATSVALGGRASSDALVFARLFSKSPLGLGVCHGHTPLSEPLEVTKAHGNVVWEIDGKPAFDVWKEHTRESAARQGIDVDTLRKEDEGAFMGRFEAGLAVGSAYKIRAPLFRSADGSMSFACGIPEGTVIRITESTPDAQVTSARDAARRAKAALAGRKIAGALVFDCICRSLILGNDFGRAVRGMAEELGNVPLAGFATYGEIALDAGDMSGFHNTTSVVLAFPVD
jgi:methyl-accepting chemotaxis protein